MPENNILPTKPSYTSTEHVMAMLLVRASEADGFDVDSLLCDEWSLGDIDDALKHAKEILTHPEDLEEEEPLFPNGFMPDYGEGPSVGKFWIVKHDQDDQYLKNNKDGTNKKYLSIGEARGVARKYAKQNKKRLLVLELVEAFEPPRGRCESTGGVMAEQEIAPCKTCEEPSAFPGAKHCTNCWEVETRLDHYFRSERGRTLAENALKIHSLKKGAAEAVEIFDEDELERYAGELREAQKCVLEGHVQDLLGWARTGDAEEIRIFLNSALNIDNMTLSEIKARFGDYLPEEADEHA